MKKEKEEPSLQFATKTLPGGSQQTQCLEIYRWTMLNYNLQVIAFLPAEIIDVD